MEKGVVEWAGGSRMAFGPASRVGGNAVHASAAEAECVWMAVPMPIVRHALSPKHLVRSSRVFSPYEGERQASTRDRNPVFFSFSRQIAVCWHAS
jgi:hypothetical protein